MAQQKVRVSWNGRKILDQERGAAARGLRKGMEYMLQKSREQVPHEDGDLERSGTASVDEESLTGAVSYDTPYAVEQHENLTYRHDEGRKAKYLEDPMMTYRGQLGKFVAAEIRREFKS